MFKLVLKKKAEIILECILRNRQIVIGNAEECDIRIEDKATVGPGAAFSGNEVPHIRYNIHRGTLKRPAQLVAHHTLDLYPSLHNLLIWSS